MDNLSREQVKKIIERGRENGRVLHVSEAFNKYPVEEEDHKGKIEYFLDNKGSNIT